MPERDVEIKMTTTKPNLYPSWGNVGMTKVFFAFFHQTVLGMMPYMTYKFYGKLNMGKKNVYP